VAKTLSSLLLLNGDLYCGLVEGMNELRGIHSGKLVSLGIRNFGMEVVSALPLDKRPGCKIQCSTSLGTLRRELVNLGSRSDHDSIELALF
jgi:hypothetical protein